MFNTKNISTVKICNMALSTIGQPDITDIEEPSESARHCRILFDIDRDAVMSSFPWRFAVTIRELVQFKTSSFFPGFEFVYKSLPDSLRLIKLINPYASHTVINNNEAQLEKYRVVSDPDTGLGLILSNIQGAYIEYIRRVTDPTFWDALFVDALVFKLAASLSSAISGSGQRMTELLNAYELSLQNAKVVNANNDSTIYRTNTSLRDSRR